MSEYEMQMLNALLVYAQAKAGGVEGITPPFTSMRAAEKLIDQYEKRQLHEERGGGKTG